MHASIDIPEAVATFMAGELVIFTQRSSATAVFWNSGYHLDDLRRKQIKLYRVKGHFEDDNGATIRIEGTPNHVAFYPAPSSNGHKIVVIGKELPDDILSFIA